MADVLQNPFHGHLRVLIVVVVERQPFLNSCPEFIVGLFSIIQHNPSHFLIHVASSCASIPSAAAVARSQLPNRSKSCGQPCRWASWMFHAVTNRQKHSASEGTTTQVPEQKWQGAQIE